MAAPARYAIVSRDRRWPVCGAHLWPVLETMASVGREPDRVEHATADEECPLCR